MSKPIPKHIIEEFQPAMRERQRQIEQEGWTQEHDDDHKYGELAQAAACYASPEKKRSIRSADKSPWLWPFSGKWWKPSPTDRLRELDKAMALLAAERSRIVRLQNKIQ